MTDVLAISLQSMQQDMTRLDRISMNLANATTPGYKRDVVSVLPAGTSPFAQVVTGEQARRLAGPGAAAAGPEAALGALMVQSDVRPGTLKATGQSLDIALAGAGYFEVATEDGPAYTRQGNWRLDARGRLTTAQGHAVMGRGGEVVLNHPNPVIDAAGQVFERKADGGTDLTPVAQLKVVEFEGRADLQRLGDGLFGSAQQPTLVADTDVRLRQGYVENSNVSSMHEMVQLIQSMRHFETMQKVAVGYDDMVGAAVRKLGDLT